MGLSKEGQNNVTTGELAEHALWAAHRKVLHCQH